MHPESEALFLSQIKDECLVLDIGGGGDPSERADYIIDIMSWETWDKKYRRRPKSAYRFSRETWYQQDVCAGRFPFPDNMFDFSICSHTLEDVRDPIAVCKELLRVSKAGYIETPSPYIELTRGMDLGHWKYAGYYHHRWLVSREGQGLVFFGKPHFVHESRRFHFPPRYRKLFRQRNLYRTQLMWSGSFSFCELILLDREDVEDRVEVFIEEVCGPNLAIRWHRSKKAGWSLLVAGLTYLGIKEKVKRLLLGQRP